MAVQCSFDCQLEVSQTTKMPQNIKLWFQLRWAKLDIHYAPLFIARLDRSDVGNSALFKWSFPSLCVKNYNELKSVCNARIATKC